VIEKLRTFDTPTKRKFLPPPFFLCVYINPILDGKSLTSMKCEALSSLIAV